MHSLPPKPSAKFSIRPSVRNSGFVTAGHADALNRNLEKRRLIPMKIALGVSGGVAAYKAAEIVRLLQDRGVRVQVVMTHAAQEFIRPLTFAALSGEKVITDMFAPDGEHQPNIDSAIEHIAVA